MSYHPKGSNRVVMIFQELPWLSPAFIGFRAQEQMIGEIRSDRQNNFSGHPW
jgi:hypothetical protein